MNLNSYQPKISIITPNFNYSDYLSELLNSVISQNYDNKEHIIVDDGSTDDSISIIEDYKKQHPFIKLIKQSNLGQTVALNNALRQVTGDIICWINSDDLFCANCFNQVIEIFQKKEYIDAVFGNILLIDQQGQIIRYNKYLPFNYSSGVFNGFGRIIPSNGIFWKTILTKKTGEFDEDFEFAMDAEYWSRLLYRVKIVHINEPLAKWRQHSMAKTHLRQKKVSKEKSIADLENFKILMNNYRKLKISFFIPKNLYFIPKIISKVIRVSLRLINGHYNYFFT